MGRLRPEVQTLTLLYTIFDRKGTPFVIENCTPFHIPTERLFKNFSLEKPLLGRISCHVRRSVRVILKGPFNTEMTVFPALFYTSTREIPTLLCISSLKRVPLSSPSPAPYRHQFGSARDYRTHVLGFMVREEQLNLCPFHHISYVDRGLKISVKQPSVSSLQSRWG